MLTKRDSTFFVELRKIIIKIDKKEAITTEDQSLLLAILCFQAYRCDQALISKKDINSMHDFFEKIEPERLFKDFKFLTNYQWKIHISKDFKFPITDYSVIPYPRGKNPQKFFCPLSPELLLEIDVTLARTSIDIIFEEASQEIIDEYTNECIKHSFKYIISSNAEVLEQIKKSESFYNRRKELGYVK